eukprot:11198783-Lingulodinium_polyedra.AAC.1
MRGRRCQPRRGGKKPQSRTCRPQVRSYGSTMLSKCQTIYSMFPASRCMCPSWYSGGLNDM